jgi:hypothetical protein
MMQYRKITELLAGRLKPKEASLFYCLALKSDFFTNESYITQDSLAKFYGIKDVDQIREWLYKFQSKGLLIIVKSKVKGQYGTFQKCKYILNAEHYNMISDLLKEEPISSQLKGFLILLKCKCLNGTNTTKFSQNQLAKELGISVGAISQYMKDAIDNAYVCKDEKGIHLLREDIFLKAKTEFRKAKSVKPKEKLVVLMD